MTRRCRPRIHHILWRGTSLLSSCSFANLGISLFLSLTCPCIALLFLVLNQKEFCYEDSPYVVQTQSAFKLDVDLSLSELYCHLAKHWLKTNDITVELKTWAVEYDSKTVPDTCFDGKSRGEIGLEFISQMWDAYDSRPKFAFLNALAAHDYSLDAAHVSLGAEGYDAVVHRFLRSILARKDSRDTYVVLRSDHGLQGNFDHTCQCSLL